MIPDNKGNYYFHRDVKIRRLEISVKKGDLVIVITEYIRPNPEPKIAIWGTIVYD